MSEWKFKEYLPHKAKTLTNRKEAGSNESFIAIRTTGNCERLRREKLEKSAAVECWLSQHVDTEPTEMATVINSKVSALYSSWLWHHGPHWIAPVVGDLTASFPKSHIPWVIIDPRFLDLVTFLLALYRRIETNLKCRHLFSILICEVFIMWQFNKFHTGVWDYHYQSAFNRVLLSLHYW